MRDRVKIVFGSLVVNIILNIITIYFLKMGLIGAVISWIVSWIMLWLRSFKLIHKNEKIHFDIKFFLGNAIVIIGLTAIFYLYKGRFLILDDAHR